MSASRRRFTNFASVAIACAWAAPSQAQVAVGSTFHLGGYADANQYDGTSRTDFFMDQHFGTLDPFSHSLSVTDLDAANAGSLTVNSSASAAWVSAGQGSVAWRGMGWVYNTKTSSGSKLNGFVLPGPVWSYTFTATSNGVFTMNYDVRGTGNVFGLLGAVIEWSGQGGDLDLTNSYNPAANGVFTRDLVAGTGYRVGLANMGNVFNSPIPRNDFGYLDADFDWHVGPVPEPTTLPGFGLACTAFFRKRRKSGSGRRSSGDKGAASRSGSNPV